MVDDLSGDIDRRNSLDRTAARAFPVLLLI